MEAVAKSTDKPERYHSRRVDPRLSGMLKEAEAGVPVPDLLRRHGVSRAVVLPLAAYLA